MDLGLIINVLTLIAAICALFVWAVNKVYENYIQLIERTIRLIIECYDRINVMRNPENGIVPRCLNISNDESFRKYNIELDDFYRLHSEPLNERLREISGNFHLLNSYVKLDNITPINDYNNIHHTLIKLLKQAEKESNSPLPVCPSVYDHIYATPPITSPKPLFACFSDELSQKLFKCTLTLIEYLQSIPIYRTYLIWLRIINFFSLSGIAWSDYRETLRRL